LIGCKVAVRIGNAKGELFVVFLKTKKTNGDVSNLRKIDK